MKKVWTAVSCILALASQALAADEADDSEVLSEVTVFAERARAATKTDTALVEIPQSISVVTSDQIAERGSLAYQDVFRYSAGVDTERFGSDTRSDDISARGFTVAQYLDELNRMPDFVYGSRTEVFTLERAEILRGPSAVLYGAGTAGGLLNAVSKRPETKFSADVGLRFGNNKLKQFQGDITGALNASETLAARFVTVQRDGELQSKGQQNDRQVYLPSISWKPREGTDITLIGLYSKEDLGTQTYLPLSRSLNATGGNRLPIDFFVGEPGFNHMDTDHKAATLLISHRINPMLQLSSNSRYTKQDVDYGEVYGSYYRGVDPFEGADHNDLTREFYVLDEEYRIKTTDNRAQLDFETGALAHKVLVGADYTEFEQDRQEGFSCNGVTDGSFGCFIGGSPPPLNVANPVYGQPFDSGFTNAYTTRSTQLGFYLQDQIKLGDRVSFVAGVRRDRATSQASDGPVDVAKATTFRTGLIVEVVKGISPYLSYSESFLPVPGGDFYGNPFKPREGRQYEGGVKWQPRTNSLVTVSVFDIEETNNITGDPDNIQNFIQTGAVGSKGVEIEANTELWRNFTLTASWSYTKAETLDATVDHAAGDPLEDQPTHLASIWGAQVFDVNDSLALRVGAGVRRVGDKIDYYLIQPTPAVTLVDASVEAIYDKWNLSINANNLADKEFYAMCSAWSFPDGVCHPGLTRSVVATISRKF